MLSQHAPLPYSTLKLNSYYMNLFFELVFRHSPILGILICDTQTWKNVNVQCQSCAVFPCLITIALSGSFSAYSSANESSSNLLLLSDHPFASPSSAAQTTDTPACERDARRRRVRAKWPQLVSRQTHIKRPHACIAMLLNCQ
jgi:hypothetical protein